MKFQTRQLLRDARDHRLATAAIRAGMRGDAVRCPCCDSSFRRFRSFNGADRICWVCGSMERHRSIWLYLDLHPEMLRDGISILHVAPERILQRRLAAVPRATYVGGDLTREFGPERIDVTDIQFADDTFDAVVCNHVLEHVPDDRRAMSEIHRVLRPGGWALLQVPDLEWNDAAVTAESPSISDPEEQLRLYGQRDHVRRYGWDYVDRLAAAGLEVEVVRPELAFPSATIAEARLAKRGHVEPLFIGRKMA